MRHRTPPIASYLLALICFALFVTSVMAACNQSQRADTIHASLLAVDTARSDFVPWDLKHQQTILDRATTRDQVEADLAKYRQTQATIRNSFEVAYRALALAGAQNDDPSLSTALQQAADLVASVKKLINGGP